MHSVFYKARRISRPYLIGRYVFGNNASCTYNSTLADSYRIADGYIDTNKYIFLNCDFSKSEYTTFFTRIQEMGKYGCPSCEGRSFLYSTRTGVLASQSPTYPVHRVLNNNIKLQ